MVALPVNLLVLPMIPFAMLMVFIIGTLGSINLVVAIPFSYLTQGALFYIFTVVNFFASLPFATVTIPSFSFWIVIVVYSLFGAFVWFASRQE